jgi:hypothetical protein
MSLDVFLYLQGEAYTETWTCTCERCGHQHERSNDGRLCVHNANITHNLGRMASEAGIYTALWRPDEMFGGKPGGPRAHARDLIMPLRRGLAMLKGDRARFEAFNAPNGWGLYEHFVPFVEKYLAACEEYPDAIVEVSR